MMKIFLGVTVLATFLIRCYGFRANFPQPVLKSAKFVVRNPTASFDEGWDDTLKLGADLLKVKCSPTEIVGLCDRVDASPEASRERFLLTLRRSSLLSEMLQRNRTEYQATSAFLKDRIPRDQFPNLQDIPISIESISTVSGALSSQDLIADCTLANVTYSSNILDDFLLSIFRKLVQKEINWKSSVPGISGLLEEGRHYMLSTDGTPENQHKFVKTVLAGLMTPVLPPFYRIFMSGIIPSKERNDPDWLVSIFDSIRNLFPESIQSKIAPGTQFGPWFYAPWLTSVVTPTFLNFLVGPSRINRRKDGGLGGIVVNKCKFLQESGCKGLCLHQCKIPAQQFFQEELGLDLTVSPNFETQECQWSWGEKPLPVEVDPSFPKGCLVGCPTREIVRERGLLGETLSNCNRA